MGMAGMNMGVNPFVQLLNQGGLPPNWANGLSGMFSLRQNSRSSLNLPNVFNFYDFHANLSF